MRKVLSFVAIVLSLIVLAAHFLRDGNTPLVAAAMVLIGLLFVREVWTARVVQAALVLGALEWLWTLHRLVETRVALGQPYTRMAVILGIVAAVTFCSALLFQTRALRKMYGLEVSADRESEHSTDAS